MRSHGALLAVLVCVSGCAAEPEPVAPELVVAEPVSVVPLPPPPLPPPPPKPDPAELLGLTPMQVQALLGAPAFVRWEDHAQLAQYRGPGCVFDLFFYEEAPGEHFRADHVEARDGAGAPADAQACLITLLPGGKWPQTD